MWCTAAERWSRCSIYHRPLPVAIGHDAQRRGPKRMGGFQVNAMPLFFYVKIYINKRGRRHLSYLCFCMRLMVRDYATVRPYTPRPTPLPARMRKRNAFYRLIKIYSHRLLSLITVK